MPDREAAAARQPQTFANHARTDPAYFYFFSLCVLASTVCAVVSVIREPDLNAAALILLNVGVMGVFLRARSYPLTVQDRVVRLEMRLRLERVLPVELKARIGELTLAQLIALRFASDEELPALMKKVLDEKITKGSDIKKLVRNWQADYLRV